MINKQDLLKKILDENTDLILNVIDQLIANLSDEEIPIVTVNNYSDLVSITSLGLFKAVTSYVDSFILREEDVLDNFTYEKSMLKEMLILYIEEEIYNYFYNESTFS